MNVLLLSSGGGGGNILRSVKALFRRDLVVTQKNDARYAERLRRAVTTRFLDTNEFSLTDVPKEERLVIGATTTRRLGSMHNPELARQALEESKHEVEALLSRHSVVDHHRHRRQGHRRRHDLCRSRRWRASRGSS